MCIYIIRTTKRYGIIQGIQGVATVACRHRRTALDTYSTFMKTLLLNDARTISYFYRIGTWLSPASDPPISDPTSDILVDSVCQKKPNFFDFTFIFKNFSTDRTIKSYLSIDN